MVTEIPKQYTASPSSYCGTPHLTINRDVAVDLDSTNAFEGPEKLLEVWFSPSANLLPASAQPLGLKAVPADVWTSMLDLVNCKVLSIVESQDVDAYLLSESSMFVWPHKLVLKTCGTTTLLYGLPRMLEIAITCAGFPGVPADLPRGVPAAATPHRVFYSRKNFLHPEQQRGPHRSWRDEVKFMDKMFMGGSAYMIGKMNGEHWYLYITGPGTRLTPPATPDGEPIQIETETKFLSVPQGLMVGSGSDEAQDETLEVLMTDLDEQNARQFYLEDASAVAEGRYFQKAREARKCAIKSLGVIEEERSAENSLAGSTLLNGSSNNNDNFDVFEQTSSDHSGFPSDESDDDLTFPEELTTEGHSLGTVVSDHCGLSDIYPTSKYPDARIDAYLFTPCGFSANGVIPAPDGPNGTNSTHYFTVHVTPEPHCSYASFETNVPARQSGRETADIVEHVVGIFKPGRFSVTLFEAKPVSDDTVASAAKRSARMDHIEGYRRIDRIVHDLDGYDLVFRYYERFDWKGGAPRLGEIGC
ncbi:S-adenosylmethionine decarboxylase [Phyllosticta capitalensis]|uniref:S-adenosylmethionine decarboxylase n=1 Tax=Phyllosticta capitalensis TaxID=121624 RepID=A0ABR1YGM9_9PEZI